MDQRYIIPVKMINSVPVAMIPLELSRTFPSRGMLMALCEISDHSFVVPLEPDGNGSHFFLCLDPLSNLIHNGFLPNIGLTLLPAKDWPDPELPNDLLNRLTQEGLLFFWNQITVKAKWEWIRWIRSTLNVATRQKRLDLACIKLSHGDKRPCCFDSSRCTMPDLSKTGRLLLS